MQCVGTEMARMCVRHCVPCRRKAHARRCVHPYALSAFTTKACNAERRKVRAGDMHSTRSEEGVARCRERISMHPPRSYVALTTSERGSGEEPDR